MKKSTIHNYISIPTNHQPPIIAQPSKCSFYFPATFVTSYLSAIMVFLLPVIAPVGANQFHTAQPESFSQRVTIISLVGNQPLGVLARSTSPFSWDGNILYRFFEQRDFCRRRRVLVVSQRNTLAVDHHHPLRSFAPFGLSDAWAPFFAGAKLSSANASDQSSCPRSSSSDKKIRHAFRQTPCSSQSFNRRQQVEGLGYCLGKSAYGAPVRRIHKIPSKTLRLSAQGTTSFPRFLGFG